MADSIATIWDRCLQSLESTIPAQPFHTWIRPIQLVDVNNGGGQTQSVATIGVPDEFHRTWITHHYEREFKSAFVRAGLREPELRFTVVVPVGGDDAVPDIPTVGQAPAPKPVPRRPDTLNPRYTFDDFIEADCNRLARSAGLAVAQRPGATSFNPFLIYGKVGLGKTHLAHAIGNLIADEHPDLRVLYLTSEAFTNAFVHAIQQNMLADFARSFRAIDVLIVDDVQFLSGKEKTQEQFFHLFNDLHQNGAQIVLCADRPPAEIAGIEDRLLSRFRWGLSADVQPPDFETRIAILQRRASRAGLDLPFEVVEYIAANVTDNIRVLEGALNRLLAVQQIDAAPLTLDFVEPLLADVIQVDRKRSLSASGIRDSVADFYRMSPDLLIGKSRKRPIVDARHIAMHFCKLHTPLSLEAIGRRFGGRDHSTVIHACRAVQARIDTDPAFVEELESLERRLIPKR